MTKKQIKQIANAISYNLLITIDLNSFDNYRIEHLYNKEDIPTNEEIEKILSQINKNADKFLNEFCQFKSTLEIVKQVKKDKL